MSVKLLSSHFLRFLRPSAFQRFWGFLSHNPDSNPVFGKMFGYILERTILLLPAKEFAHES